MTGAARDIADFRREIDRLDEQLIDLLARRMGVAHEVAAYKIRHGVPVRIPERIEAVLRRCIELGVQRDLDPAYVRALWSAIIEETCRVEESLLARKPGPSGP